MSQVDLSWTDNSGTQFRVYRSTVDSPSFPNDYTEIGTTAAGVSTLTDSSPPVGTVTYAVTAFNADGESSETTDTVSVPRFLTVTVGSDADVGGNVALDRTRSVTATAGVDAEAGGSTDLARARTLSLAGGLDAEAGGAPTLSRSRVLPASPGVDFDAGGSVVARIQFTRLQYSALLGSTQELVPAAGTADREDPATGATEREAPAGGTAARETPSAGTTEEESPAAGTADTETPAAGDLDDSESTE